MIPGRASVLADRYGTHLLAGVPRTHTDRVKAIPGAEWDYGLLRWRVPVAQESALRAALAGLTVSWAADHRTAPRGRCDVCGGLLAQSLVAAGDRRHIGCVPPVDHPTETAQEALL